MKKISLVLVIALFVASCSSTSGRVCGSSRGARCVEKASEKDIFSPIKENS